MKIWFKNLRIEENFPTYRCDVNFEASIKKNEMPMIMELTVSLNLSYSCL